MLFLFRKRARWVKETWVPYMVKDNETLAQLATKHKVAWKLIAKVNGVKPPYNISGLEIKLPPLDGHRPSRPPGQSSGQMSGGATKKMTGEMQIKRRLPQEPPVSSAKKASETKDKAEKSKPKKKRVAKKPKKSVTKKSLPKKRATKKSATKKSKPRKRVAKKKTSGKNPLPKKRK